MPAGSIEMVVYKPMRSFQTDPTSAGPDQGGSSRGAEGSDLPTEKTEIWKQLTDHIWLYKDHIWLYISELYAPFRVNRRTTVAFWFGVVSTSINVTLCFLLEDDPRVQKDYEAMEVPFLRLLMIYGQSIMEEFLRLRPETRASIALVGTPFIWIIWTIALEASWIITFRLHRTVLFIRWRTFFPLFSLALIITFYSSGSNISWLERFTRPYVLWNVIVMLFPIFLVLLACVAWIFKWLWGFW